MALLTVAGACDRSPTTPGQGKPGEDAPGLPTGYRVVPLSMTDSAGKQYYPVALNARGEVAATATNQDFGLWKDGWMARYSVWSGGVTGVSDDGTLAGSTPERPFVATGGKVWYLAGAGLEGGRALGISAGGAVFGVTGPTSGAIRGFIWTPARLTLIDVPGDSSSTVVAANDAGDVLVGSSGRSFCGNGHCERHGRAYIWREGELTEVHAPAWKAGAWTVDPQFPFASVYPNDVNDRGDVVGSAVYWLCVAGTTQCRGWYRPFLWRDGKAVGLGLPDEGIFSRALRVNENRRVLIEYRPDTGPQTYLWNDGRLLDLNRAIAASGWVIGNAVDLNDRDQILAYARQTGGPVTPVLLEPIR